VSELADRLKTCHFVVAITTVVLGGLVALAANYLGEAETRAWFFLALTASALIMSGLARAGLEPVTFLDDAIVPILAGLSIGAALAPLTAAPSGVLGWVASIGVAAVLLAAVTLRAIPPAR
jgi:hypothetical protein